MVDQNWESKAGGSAGEKILGIEKVAVNELISSYCYRNLEDSGSYHTSTLLLSDSFLEAKSFVFKSENAKNATDRDNLEYFLSF